VRTKVNQAPWVQASIFDSALGETNRLSKRVNKGDKEKGEESLTAARDLEKRLELRVDGVGCGFGEGGRTHW